MLFRSVDGTRAFVSGMPTWATLIGLSFEGRPMLGLMNQPVVGDMFFGNPEGAWHSYRGAVAPIATRKSVPLSRATLGTTDPPRHDRLRSLIQHAFNKRNLDYIDADTFNHQDLPAAFSFSTIWISSLTSLTS